MRVYVCVCMHARVRECGCVYVCVFSVYTGVRRCVCMCVCMHVRVCVCAFMRVFGVCVWRS
jgi:hypothetical protein